MTNIIHPQNFRAITALDAQKRRRPTGMAQDGEYIGFDLAFADAAPAASTIRNFNDAERAIRAQVDREHGAHDAKFAFLGDAAPAFDRERATFLARAKFGLHLGDSGTAHSATVAAERTRSLAGARFGDGAKLVDMVEGDKPAPRSLNAATSTQDAAGQSRPAAISALRALRYQG